MSTAACEEVMPGFYRIPVPLRGNPLKELNSYVIRGNAGERNLLIDTGFRTEDCREAICEGLVALDIRMDRTDIVLTHLHADHSGNAPDLITDGGRIYIGETDKKLLIRSKLVSSKDPLHEARASRMRKCRIPEAVIRDMLQKAPSRTMASRPDYLDFTSLQDGDELSCGGYRLRAVLTPGHTPGHLCFEVEGTGAMLLGDHVLFDITPNIVDWPGIPDSLGNYLLSLDKIDAYDVTLPLPGHRARGDFHTRIAELKKHHEKRLDECCGIIRELHQATLYEIAGRVQWKIRAADWDHFPAGQKWFAIGECLAHIDRLTAEGRVRVLEEDGKCRFEAV